MDVDVYTAVETLVVGALVVGALVVEAVLGAGLEAVVTALFEAVVAAVVLEDADFLFSADASGTAAVVFGRSDADVLADALLVTGRAGLLGLRLLLLFPSSALDCYLLLSLDLFGLLVVLVGRWKDAERDSVDVLVHVIGVCDRCVCCQAWQSCRCAISAPCRSSDRITCRDSCDEYSRDSGVEIQPGDFGGTRILCKTATRLAKQTRPM